MWVQVHLQAPPPNLVVPIEWKEKTPPISSGPNCSWKGHLNPSYRLIFHGIRPRKSWLRDFPVGFPPTPPDRIHSQLLQKGEPQSVSQLFESSDGQNWKFTKARMIALGNIYHLILVCWRYLTFKTIRSFDFSNLSSALWSLPEILHVARIFPK